MSHHYFVYILSNFKRTTLYIGITSNLEKILYEHKNKLIKGFSEKYNCDRLVYFEDTKDIESAIAREKQLKKWKREWKDELIQSDNPQWLDLSQDWEM